jgi:DNA-binding NtrC family response regulator
MQPLVFVVDDDPDQVSLVVAQLERTRAFRTRGFTSARAALRAHETEPADAVITDLRMPEVDGFEFIRRLRRSDAGLPILVLTAHGEEDEAAQAFDAGATDFVTKPVDPVTLRTRLTHALKEAPSRRLLTEVTSDRFNPNAIVGQHPKVQAVRAFVQRVAAVPQITVLLLGESGTGKNLVARAIHGAGPNPHAPFVDINCAALPSSLLEAELFGYEKGAFTGAEQTKRGLVEAADGGTLFLDEIGHLPLELQAKLLSFLESRTFRRLGSVQERTAQVRIIAATNANLAALVAQGVFRADLYYRLNVASHVLPPLREIASDIPEMTAYFVERAARYFGKPVPRLEPRSVERLQRYSWPGNARELRNVVERSLIFADGPVLEVLAPEENPETDGEVDGILLPRGLTLEEVERRYIAATLEEVGGNVALAAQRLGISRKVLWQRRRKLGLLPPRSHSQG